MTQTPEQPDREKRISDEIVVDAYNETECAIGWHCYLQDRLHVPFEAYCTTKRTISPLKVGEAVQVVGMAEADDCMSEIFVLVRYGDSELAVPLGQLECQSGDEATCEAVADWHYWLARGYSY
ncbi:Calcium binding [Azotobacter beijerinckii]|uniref:Calcium binding n=1 Tax=Azotobacter beijerinckii TaxID=170623 RepID=A0A1H6UMK1_9GAMM|nr:calcium-binding protein [Azotobacter beijerinckii]SEI93603.1 Calcium binding [Azotobacter beijerinckii]SEJ29636.1 Calcium binding [Azotobacter beijerinckii]